MPRRQAFCVAAVVLELPVPHHAKTSPFRYDAGSDPYPSWLLRVLRTWANHGRAAASDVLREHPYRRAVARPGEGRPLPRPRTLTKSGFGLPENAAPPRALAPTDKLGVWLRDGWQCCLCTRPLFAPAALHMIACGFYGYTDERGEALFPWGPRNSFDDFHQAVWPGWAVIGHIWPERREAGPGHRSDHRNLAAICWQCNDRHGTSFIEELPKPPNVTTASPRSDWDGLVSLYIRCMTDDPPDAAPLPYPSRSADRLGTHTRSLETSLALYQSATATPIDVLKPF
jgi:hypothetical protein